jgi:hypothetical protein
MNSYADLLIGLSIALVTIVAGLVAYIFVTFRKDSQTRFGHIEKLAEEMAKNNNQLNELINGHEYRLRNIEAKLQINHAQT